MCMQMFLKVRSGSMILKYIKMQQTSRQKTGRFECDSFNQQKYTQCSESYIVRELGCRPSWFKEGLDESLTTCSGSEKYSLFLEESQNLRKDGIICNIPNCLENVWTTQDIMTTELDLFNQENLTLTAIEFSAISKTIQISNEVFSYELFDIFNDFAGVISLFLGASIISSFDYIKEKFEKMYNIFTTRF